VYSDKVKIHHLRPISAYNASTVRAIEEVPLSRIGSRLRDFQRAIDEVRTLPLTPPKCGSKKANLSFKNKFPHISVIAEARDFKFGKQLGFAKSHHQISPEQKMDVALS